MVLPEYLDTAVVKCARIRLLHGGLALKSKIFRAIQKLDKPFYLHPKEASSANTYIYR